MWPDFLPREDLGSSFNFLTNEILSPSERRIGSRDENGIYEEPKSSRGKKSGHMLRIKVIPAIVYHCLSIRVASLHLPVIQPTYHSDQYGRKFCKPSMVLKMWCLSWFWELRDAHIRQKEEVMQSAREEKRPEGDKCWWLGYIWDTDSFLELSSIVPIHPYLCQFR